MYRLIAGKTGAGCNLVTRRDHSTSHHLITMCRKQVILLGALFEHGPPSVLTVSETGDTRGTLLEHDPPSDHNVSETGDTRRTLLEHVSETGATCVTLLKYLLHGQENWGVIFNSSITLLY